MYIIRLQEYLDTTATGTIGWNVRKVIVIGEEASGKTTLTQCLSSKANKVDVSVK